VPNSTLCFILCPEFPQWSAAVSEGFCATCRGRLEGDDLYCTTCRGVWTLSEDRVEIHYHRPAGGAPHIAVALRDFDAEVWVSDDLLRADV
jgi:hypothetical protein